MLKLIKSKAFKVAGLTIALAMALIVTTAVNAEMTTTTTTTSAFNYSGLMKVGSSGPGVSTLQAALNEANIGTTVIVDGDFGPATKTAVMKFQMSRNLTADGVVGSMTGQALSQASVGVITVPSTGLCPNGMTLASNCMMAPGSMNPVVTGGAGNIQTVEVLSSVSNEKVGEGDMDHKVFAYTVEADNGSDLAINSVKLNLSRTSGTGSNKINRYASKVSVWMGSTKVGSADISTFSESLNVYSKSISLSGAIIKADKKETFYVSVDALSNIDSTDLASNTWTVTLESTRFSDATGAILTNTAGSILKTFSFASLATASDVELKVNLSSSNMKAKTTKVSTTSDTSQVELLRFTMKAQGSNMVIDQIPVLFTTSETDLDEVTSNVTLKIGGNTYNETVTTSTAATATVLFNDLNLSISKDSTVEGVIYADVNDIETSTFDEGTTLKAEITSALVAATSGNYIDVEDMNQDQLVTGDRTGSAIGEAMTFRSTGVNVVMSAASYDRTVDNSGNITSVTYTIPVAVTAFGNTLYIGQTAQLATTASASNAFAYVFQNSSAPTVSDVAATASSTLSSTNAVLDGNGFRLDDGTTKNFTITVNLTTPTTGNNSYRVALKDLKTFTDSSLSTGASANALTPVESFQTDYKLITS